MFYKTFDADGNYVGIVGAPRMAAGLPLAATLAPVAEDTLALEVAYGPPQLKALAAVTLAAGVWGATQYAGDAPDYGGPLVNPIPPSPPGGPLITPEDGQRGPSITSYPAEQNSAPSVEGLPMSQPGGAGVIGGGFGAGGVADQPSILLKTPADILGENLEAAGMPKPGPGYQPHHIIPEGDPRAADLRQMLSDAGIPINDDVNGVWLPQNANVPNAGETPHNETFRNSYFDYLNLQFDGASAGDPADILARLSAIRNDLLNHVPTLPKK